MQVELSDDKYTLTFDYNPELIDFCKSLQKASYSVKTRCWTAERSIPNALSLHSAGYFTDSDMLANMSSRKVNQNKGYVWQVSANLYEHQTKFASWCVDKPKAMLVAEMGLGKTLMAMLWLKEHGIPPSDCLVICPSSLISNWVNEFKRFTGVDVLGVQGTTGKRVAALDTPGLHVVNYEYFARNSQAAAKLSGKQAIILDESHRIKTPSSEQSKVIHKFSEKTSHVLLLTGTPVSQGAQDYYSQFKTINPKLLGSTYTGFKHRYCITEPVRGAPIGVTKITGYKDLDQLTTIIAPYTITLLKKNCLQLPEKMYATRYISLSPEQRKMYAKIKDEMAVILKDDAVTAQHILTRMLRLSQITQGFLCGDDGKVVHTFSPSPKYEMLLEYLEELGGHQSAVIFCRFREDMLSVERALMALNRTYVQIHGDIPISLRQTYVDQFQSGKVNTLIGQIQTAGVGITLTAAQHMLFFSNSYSLVDRLQAEDRIHRIGSTGEHCFYTDIVAENTVDEHVIAALRNKRSVADNLTELRQIFSLA